MIGNLHQILPQKRIELNGNPLSLVFVWRVGINQFALPVAEQIDLLRRGLRGTKVVYRRGYPPGTASGPIPSFRLRNDTLIASVHLPWEQKQNTNGLQVA